MNAIIPSYIGKGIMRKIRDKASKYNYWSRKRIQQYHPEAVFTKGDNKKMIGHLIEICLKVLLGFPVLCDFCKMPIKTLEELSFDHKIPIGPPETHVVSNVVPCHRKCNSQKGRMMPYSPEQSIRGSWHSTRFHYIFKGANNDKDEDNGTFKRTTIDKKGNIILDMEGTLTRSTGNKFLIESTNLLRHPKKYAPEGEPIGKTRAWINDEDRLIFVDLPWEGKYLRMRKTD